MRDVNELLEQIQSLITVMRQVETDSLPVVETEDQHLEPESDANV